MKLMVGARGEAYSVMKGDGLKDCAKLMKSVGAATEYAKRPVYLCIRGEREKIFRHDGRLTFLKRKREAARVRFG